MVPLSWGFLGGNKKGLSPSSNTYVAVAHKLSFSFSEPMSDTEFVGKDCELFFDSHITSAPLKEEIKPHFSA